MHGQPMLHCPKCARARAVETPPCRDGHGSDCPDRACAICGTALFMDPHTTNRPAPGRRAA